MSVVAQVRATLEELLPRRFGPELVSAQPEEVVEDEVGLIVPLTLTLFDGESITVSTEQRVPMVLAADLGASDARVQAYLEGWVAALPTLLPRVRAVEGEFAAPISCVCPPALGDLAAETAADFTALILSEDGPMKAWQANFAEETSFFLEDDVYEDFLAEEETIGADELDERRARATADVTAEFPAVRDHVLARFGLELPRSVIAFEALRRSLTPAEAAAYEALGLPRAVGVLDLFGPGALARPTRDGLDIRLHWRFRRDPPELLTALVGGSDGEHFGLFYDDPRTLPSGVVHTYAGDSAETWWFAPTLLGVLRTHLDRIEAESLTPDFYEDVTRAACQLRLLREAIEAFSPLEAELCAEDAPRIVLPYLARAMLPTIVGGVGVMVPGHGGALPYVVATNSEGGPRFGEPAATRAWVAEARAALDRGEPAYALGLGRDLHWADDDAWRAETRELLVRAYRMLGRDALAAIVEVHHAGRDQPSVVVL